MNRRGVLEAAVFVGVALLVRHMARTQGHELELPWENRERPAPEPEVRPSAAAICTPSEWRGEDRFRTEGQRAGLRKLRSG